MGSYPPPPPPYGYDPRAQRRMLRMQARAQRDAFRAQRAFYRYQMRGFRRRSLLGPLLLVSIGVSFLTVRTGRVSAPQALDLYSHWWPLIFLFAGLVLLLEWGFDQWMLSLNPAAPPVARRALDSGAVVLILLLSLGGIVSLVIHNHAQSMFANLGGEGEVVGVEQLFGEKHETDQSYDETIPTGASISIDNARGDVTVNGGSPDGKMHIAIHQEIYSFSKEEADRRTRDTAPRIASSGNMVSVSLAAYNGTTSDVTLTLPSTAATTVVAPRGDIRVTSINAPVNVTANHGDIELASIGGDVTARVSRNDSSFSAHTITGSVLLKGHAQDLSLTDIGGQVSLDGDFYGTTHLEQIRGALHFHTSRTDLQLARLDGEVEISPDASLSVDRAAGPTILTTRDRNITFDRIAGDISVTNSNGTVDITSAPPLGEIVVNNRRGSVNVTLPDHAGFNVDAQTTDGSVQNEFGLSASNDARRASLSGSVGHGGTHVKISTTHGDVDLRKAILTPLAPPQPPAPFTPTIHLWGQPVPLKNGKGTIIRQDGKDFVMRNNDGSSIIHKDGKTILQSRDGKDMMVQQDGKDFVMRNNDGSSIVHKNGETILHSKDGKTMEFQDH